MARRYVQLFFDWLAKAITQPRSELDRWERAARYAHDLATHGARQLRRDRAPQMAGALAFRTLFGLLPVLVMGAVVIRALRGPGEFFDQVDELLHAMDLYNIGEAGNTLGDMVGGFVRQAANYNASAIGWIGLLVLIYSAVSLMVTIENSFNAIVRAPEGRSWWKRLPMYWFVLTIGPVVIGASFWLDKRVGLWMTHVSSWKWLLAIGALVWQFAATWLVISIAYMLVPNSPIRVRPALVGACVTTLLLALGKRFLGAYLANAVSVTQFEGSLGLIPLFMFWIYVMWLVILFGLEVSATLQMLAGRKLEDVEDKRPQTGLFDPTCILAIMECIAERFDRSLPSSRRYIADECGLPESTVELVLSRLLSASIVHRVDAAEERSVTLARPPERISAGELMDIAFSLVDDGGAARSPALLSALRDAQRALAERSTLATLIAR